MTSPPPDPQQRPVHPAYRPDIDGLRAVAVLSVVAFHAFPGALAGGFVGVDVFFVISGFLISTIILGGLKQGTFSFRDFYARRIRRIFPALALVLAACAVFGWFALFPQEYRGLGKHIAGGAAFLSNFVLWQEAGYFDRLAETKVLLHLWSLGIEEQFYIFWPLLLFIVAKWRLNFLWPVVALTAISFCLNVLLLDSGPIATFYSPATRAWELYAGGLLAVLTLGRQNLVTGVLADILSALGLAAIAAAILLLDPEQPFPGWWALLPVAGTFLAILAGREAWLNRTLLSQRVVVWFGLISFPLYLWHWPLLSFARIVESTTPSRSLRITAVFVSVAFAWLTYRLVEHPLRHGAHMRAKVTALCFVMALLGLGGYLTYGGDGFVNRAAVKGLIDNTGELTLTAPRDSACIAYVGKADPQFPYCRFNRAAGREIVVMIGDSHAYVAFPGLAEMLARQGKSLVVLANSSCPPLLGVVTGESPVLRKACASRIDELLGAVIDKAEIETVLIATRGPVYLSGTRFGEISQSTRNALIHAAMAAEPEPAAPEELFRSGLQSTVDRLTSAGKKVYYLLENPEIGVDVAKCTGRPIRGTAADCQVDLRLVLARQGAYRNIVQSINGAHIVDPLEAFCPNGLCKVLDEGKLLYADDNHLSAAGSRFLADRVIKTVLFP